ncbi:xanthine dehydrogenase family protein subunit M [Orrella sp. NBD-18]|uniref:Xanthine dehydrogenase family protein subunit M n=2 Tax=Sheuella amnicola TaxID=2707330 RepID=A0A6B2R9P2_9BURK|nr:xanthine dehydrogenase family protein subunit M [Sheuella amnicola]HBI83818.1 oxidoreductase [Alcaligenaceae bacterium]
MRFESPTTAEAAAALLAGSSGLAKVLSGGTDILIQMRAAVVKPELLVNVKGIDEMTSVKIENGGYRFGAAVPCMSLVENKEFASTWPGVIDGVNLVGSVQVRGRASVGGNLCNASPAADTVPAMIAAGAVATVVGPNGRRDIPVEQITTGPGKTSLAKGELVASFYLPKRPARSGDAYMRFTPRSEMDIAVVGVGINLTLDEKGVCTAARVALGAVAEKALLVPEAAAALIGTTVDEAALDKLAAAASAAARPIDDKRGTKVFRIKIAGVLARRAAVVALNRARGNK